MSGGAEVGSGSCYRCGSSGESGRFCRSCGASLLSMADRNGKGRIRLRPTGRLGLAATISAVMLLVLLSAGAVVLARSMRTVASSGICFAGPIGGSATWPYNQSTGRLSLTFYLPPSTSRTAATYDRTAISSFHAWSAAWRVLSFHRVDNPNRAQIVIRYGNYGRAGEWLNHAGLTVPDFQMFGCGLTHATIEINNSYLENAGTVEWPGRFLRHLFVHEIGHALGLKHPHTQVVSVMVPTSNAYVWAKPQRYDIATIATLYPAGPMTQLEAPVDMQRAQLAADRPRNFGTFAGKP